MDNQLEETEVAPLSPVAEDVEYADPASYISPYTSRNKGDYSSFCFSQPVFSNGDTPGGEHTVTLTEGANGFNHPFTKSPGGAIYKEGDFLDYSDYNGQYNSLFNDLKACSWRAINDIGSPNHNQGHHDASYYKVEFCKHLVQRIITSFPAKAKETIDNLNHAIRNEAIFDLNSVAKIYANTSFKGYDWKAAEEVYSPPKPLTLDAIRNFKPDLSASWLEKYHGFVVKIPVSFPVFGTVSSSKDKVVPSSSIKPASECRKKKRSAQVLFSPEQKKEESGESKRLKTCSIKALGINI
jgi:hypothetical protein